MVRATDNAGWQRVFAMVAANSRWDLRDAVIAAHVAHSYDYVMDFLAREAGSVAYTYDPAGERALREAKRIRRATRRVRPGRGDALLDDARARFGLPATELRYAATAPGPLYLPAPRSPTS